MKKVLISAETYHLACSISLLGIAGKGTKTANGMYWITLSDETLKRLDDHRLEGESADDTIFRVLTLAIAKVMVVMLS